MGHLLVRLEYPTFEEVNRELHLLHLLHDGGLHVDTEAVFGLFRQAALDVLFDACAETGLILRSVSTVHFGEQLCIYSARLHLCLRTFLFVLRDVLAEAVGVRLDLLVDHLVGCLDDVLRDLVLAVQLGIELRSYSDIEGEGVGVLVVEIHVTLLCIRQRITQDLQFVVLDVLVQAFAHFLVQYVCQDALAVHFLYQTRRHHTRTEARHLGFVAHLFELLCNLFLIVCRLDHDRHHCHQVF